MWYEFLESKDKISSFYRKIPELNNISITGITFENCGANVCIGFEMPYFPELLLQAPPKEHNSIFVGWIV